MPLSAIFFLLLLFLAYINPGSFTHQDEPSADVILEEIQALEETIRLQQQKVELLEMLRIEYLKGNRFHLYIYITIFNSIYA